MTADVKLAHIAALLADPARARMVMALMDGRSRTVKELAFLAGVSAPTASAHLAKLCDLGLIAVSPQGRHRYHRIASPKVAEMVEAISAVAGESLDIRPPRRRADAPLLFARTCYDHLAGRLAVAIADRLQADGHVVLTEDGGEVTEGGRSFLAAEGFSLDGPKQQKRIFCRPCIDWTERRFHIAGHVGAVICSSTRERGWLRPERDSRVLHVTPEGRRGLARSFGVDVGALEERPRQTGEAA
jgi:DNA-binding transcriptional ArsR family regulator